MYLDTEALLPLPLTTGSCPLLVALEATGTGLGPGLGLGVGLGVLPLVYGTLTTTVLLLFLVDLLAGVLVVIFPGII
jgi:hypothetical protein